MPLISFDRILKILLTILNVLFAALRAFNYDTPDVSDSDESEGHA